MLTRKKNRKPIIIKILIVIILVVVAQGGTLFFVSFNLLKDGLVKEKEEDVQREMIVMQETLRYLIFEGNLARIQKVITLLGSNANVKNVLFLDERGVVIASSRIDAIGKNVDVLLKDKILNEIKQHSRSLKISLENIMWQSMEKQSLYAMTPIALGQSTRGYSHSDKIGILFVHHDIRWIDEKNKKILKEYLYFVMFVMLLIGLSLVVYFNISISRRIGIVNDFANRFENDDLDARIKTTGNDELTDLGLAFNAMANSIQEKHEELVSRERNIAITLNSIGDAVLTTDTSGYVTRMNPVAEKLTGWSFQEAEGQPLKVIFPIVDSFSHEPISNPFEKVLATGEIFHISDNAMLLSKDGTRYQITDSAAPIRGDDGCVLGMVLVFNDITEQYRLREKAEAVQQKLLIKEKEQSEMLNCIVDAVISIDEDGNIISFNKAAEILFGHSFDEIIGQNVSRLMPDPDVGRHDGYIQHYMKTGDAHVIGIGREVKGKRKDEQIFPMRLSVAELPKDVTGKRRFIGTFQDLTFIKQQEEQLHRSLKMDALGKLTGGIAHDFNNLINIITGYSDLLEEMLSDQPKLAGYAYEIHHAGDRGAKLTSKLLSFSKKEATEAAVLDINAVLYEQKDMLQKTLTVRINLVINFAEGIWPIWLDGNDLEDAVLNMSINAMCAMNEGGQLTICTRNQSLNTLDALALGVNVGDYVLLSITDTGSGMDSDTKEKIFDPFFTTKGGKGTGLGLSQVFGFVNRAGGTIKVYSEPGYGSEFVLYFPRFLDVDVDVDKAAENIENDIDLRGTENILIVDDEIALCDMTSEILREQGYEVFCADNGEQALKILEHERVDLMLSDVIMPEMDGYKLAALVKDKYPATKIQLASGFADERRVDIVDENLYQNLLRKPYNSQTLLKNIRILLDSKPDPASDILDKKLTDEENIITSLEWVDAFSVGMPELDKDHKELLSLLNRCIEVCNGTEQYKELDAILKALIDYTRYHFKHEERIMEACDYPQLREHRKAHKLLIREVQQYKREYDGSVIEADSLLGFLGRWLKGHIVGMDRAMASYCKDKPCSSSR